MVLLFHTSRHVLEHFGLWLKESDCFRGSIQVYLHVDCLQDGGGLGLGLEDILWFALQVSDQELTVVLG